MAKAKESLPENPSKPGPKPKLVRSDSLFEQLRALGRIQCTLDEAASVLRCSKRTLQVFFDANEDARELFESGKQEGCASLRRKQFAMAETNATMAIWLGKQYLGQKDIQVNENNNTHHVICDKPMSIDEWEQQYCLAAPGGTTTKPS